MRIESQCGTLTGAIWPPNNDIVQVNPVRSFKQSGCSYPQGSNRAIKHPTDPHSTDLYPMYLASMCLCATMFPLKCQRHLNFMGQAQSGLISSSMGCATSFKYPARCCGSWLNDLLTTEACNFKVEAFCTAELPLGMPPAAVQVSRRPNHVPVFSHFQPHRKAKKPTHLSSPLKGGVKSRQPNSWYIPLWPACLRVSTIKASTTPCV